MFTGIVQLIGTVSTLEVSPDFGVIRINLQHMASQVSLGESVSVNGVCLSVIEIQGSDIGFEVMGITLSKTNLGELKVGSSVNIELPLRLKDFVGGHIVQGHIDEVGSILEIEQLTHWKRMRISMSPGFQKYVVARGSITVDGVSLTVSALDTSWFEVSLIPATLEHTILGSKHIGDSVNLESDIIARHLEKLVKP